MDAFTVASRGDAGIVHYMKSKFWAGALCYAYRATSDYDTRYIAYYMDYTYDIIKKSFLTQTSIPAINKSDLDTYLIMIPKPDQKNSSLEKQIKTANILSKYDELIAIAKNQFNTLQTLKKGLLQQMFK